MGYQSRGTITDGGPSRRGRRKSELGEGGVGGECVDVYSGRDRDGEVVKEVERRCPITQLFKLSGVGYGIKWVNEPL